MDVKGESQLALTERINGIGAHRRLSEGETRSLFAVPMFARIHDLQPTTGSGETLRTCCSIYGGTGATVQSILRWRSRRFLLQVGPSLRGRSTGSAERERRQFP